MMARTLPGRSSTSWYLPIIACAIGAAVLCTPVSTSSAVGATAPPRSSTSPIESHGRTLGSTFRGEFDAPDARSGKRPPLTLGMDVSAHQPVVDWQRNHAEGARFAYVKATEGTWYKSRTFAEQYAGASSTGMHRGAYHFATPGTAPGKEQAEYFLANGGRWADDGKTLPPMLDIEWDYTGGDRCWGLDQSEMINWIADFTDTVREQTGVRPMIYTAKSWWDQCTGGTARFSDLPLFVADWAVSDFDKPVLIPSGWTEWTLWQWADDRGPFDGDSDAVNARTTLDEIATPSR